MEINVFFQLLTHVEAEMILDFIRDNLNGDTWENWCDACYRDRYQGDHFVKVPADHKGDAGIEGFTLSGVVYQCYCPDKNYTVNELYEHLRDKVTTDIAKLVKAEKIWLYVGERIYTEPPHIHKTIFPSSSGNDPIRFLSGLEALFQATFCTFGNFE